MKNKKKLKITELRIQSFVTLIDSKSAKTAKGGGDTTVISCPGNSNITVCPPNSNITICPGTTEQTWWPSNCSKITTTTTTTTTALP